MKNIDVRLWIWIWLLLLWVSDSFSSILVKALPFSVAVLLIARGMAAIALGIIRRGGVPRLKIERWTLQMAAWFALACGAYYASVKLWQVGPAIAVLTAAPAWILLRDVFKSGASRHRVIADLMLVGGMVSYVWPTSNSSSIPPLGFALAAVSAIATGEFYLASRHIANLESPERLFWLGLSVVAVGLVLLPFVNPSTVSSTPIAALRDVPSWIILPVFGAFAGGLYFLSMERLIAIEPRLAGSLAMTKTLIVVLMSRLLLHEHSSPRQFVGLAFGVLGSISVALLASKRLQKSAMGTQ